VVPVATLPTAAADPPPAVKHGSAIPHVALVASMIAGAAAVLAAVVLAGVLAVVRGRRGGPRGPEGGHIIIR
jgi:hypothetical protein